MMIGGKGVGKASLVRRFLDHKSFHNGLNTIGIDCKTKTLNIKNQKNNIKNMEYKANNKLWKFNKSIC